MKKLVIAAIAAVSLIGMQAMASVNLTLSAEDLLDNTGVNMAPLNTVGLWIVDTSGGTSLAPILTLGENIAVGTTLTGTTDKILAAADINNSTDTTGQLGITFLGNDNVNGYAVGDNFGLIWLVNQSLGVTTAQAGWYGEFTDWPGSYSNPWVLPSNNGTDTSFDLTTVSESGGVPNSYGEATLQIVPEPSSIMLVVVGLFGGIGLIRRRR